uniref:Uncharacterized protein n=1 Tax=Panagrolaimus sp. ES5 TaxID=591445 RepID=A0AC34GB71_9BILA
VAVLRRTLSSRGEEERRMAKEMDCMRESMKNLSDKNKSLLNELEKRKDIEAESVAIKSAASSIEKENELLKNEVARLKKQFVAAESRADENAHILSKATTSRSEFYKHIQEQADLTNVQSTPRPTMRQRTPSFSSHEQDDLTNVPSTPRPIMRQRTQSLTRSRREHTERKPSPIRAPVHTPIAGIRPTSSNEDTISRKRGIMIDYSEPGNRKKLDFKLHKLADNNQRRQLDHLKSHYDPDAGVYDQTYGETPAKAAKLVTPKKENKILDSILRKK